MAFPVSAFQRLPGQIIWISPLQNWSFWRLQITFKKFWLIKLLKRNWNALLNIWSTIISIQKRMLSYLMRSWKVSERQAMDSSIYTFISYKDKAEILIEIVLCQSWKRDLYECRDREILDAGKRSFCRNIDLYVQLRPISTRETSFLPQEIKVRGVYGQSYRNLLKAHK